MKPRKGIYDDAIKAANDTVELMHQVTTLPAKAGSFPEHARRDRPRYALAAPSGPG